MKQHTILLVACLMTIPAVEAADQPVDCDTQETSGSCSVTVSSQSGQESQHGSDGTGSDQGCQPLYLWYQAAYFPAGYDLNLECLIG